MTLCPALVPHSDRSTFSSTQSSISGTLQPAPLPSLSVWVMSFCQNILFRKCHHEMFWHDFFKKKISPLSSAEIICWILLYSVNKFGHVQKKSHFWQINCSQKNSFKYSLKRYTCTLTCALTIIFVGVSHGSLPMTRLNHPSSQLREDSVTTDTLKRALNNASFLNGSVQDYLAQLFL